MSNPTGWEAPKPDMPETPPAADPAPGITDPDPGAFVAPTSDVADSVPESDSVPKLISSELAPRLALDDADPEAPEATDFSVAPPGRAIEAVTDTSPDLLQLPEPPATPYAPAAGPYPTPAPSYPPPAAVYQPPAPPYGGYAEQSAGQAYGSGAAPEPGGNYAAPGFQEQPAPYPPQPAYGYPPATQPGYGYPATQAGGDTTSASMAHWLGILIGFLGPLIIMLTKGEQDRFVRANAVEALNFQITLMIGYVISGVLTAVFIGVLGFIVLPIIGLIFSILGAMAANKGEVYRYPFNIRLVK